MDKPLLHPRLQEAHPRLREAFDDSSLISNALTLDDDDKPSTLGERWADKVAEFGGSWTFIIFFGSVMLVWIGLNSLALRQHAFDPYPYILLNLVLSCLAAIQAPIIMMSQNRQETKDRQRAQNDFLINLKAEVEIRDLNKKVDALTNTLLALQQQQQELLSRLTNNNTPTA